MEILIYLTDGEKLDLAISDKQETTQLLETLNPAKLFEQRVLQIQDETVTVSVNPRAIEAIQFKTDIDPHWPSQQIMAKASAISEEEFEVRRAELEELGVPPEPKKTEPLEINAVGEMTMKSGKKIYIQVEGTLEPGDDRRRYSLRIFEAPFVLLRQSNGHLVLVNPANVDTIAVTPGAKEPSAYSWRARIL